MKETLRTIAVELAQKLNYWEQFLSVDVPVQRKDALSMYDDMRDVSDKLIKLSEPIRYSVFYDEIGVDNGDAGESVYSTPSLPGAKDFYADMERRCNFIILWDRFAQKAIQQKGE